MPADRRTLRALTLPNNQVQDIDLTYHAHLAQSAGGRGTAAPAHGLA
jgi:hypothetical protein